MDYFQRINCLLVDLYCVKTKPISDWVNSNKNISRINMRLSTIVTSLIILSQLLHAQNSYEVTYVSNEGFIVQLDDKKVLIDGLFDTIDGKWCDSPDKETVELMRNAQAPFDSISVIAITHKHRDHFDRSIVIEHLLNNPSGVLVCPQQVTKVLSEDRHYQTIRSRIVSITPDTLKTIDTTISNISIRSLRLEHSHYLESDPITGLSKNRHSNIENLGYLMRYKGKSIFHCGDTNPLNKKEYENFALHEEGVDLAFLDRLFISKGLEGWEVIDTYIQPKQIILMHIAPSNSPTFEDYVNQIPEMTLFSDKLESRTITILPSNE